MLFVVFDEAGRCLVALDEPAIAGPVEREERDGIVHVRVRDEWLPAAPDITTARVLTVAGLIWSIGGAVTVSAIVSPWVGVPVGVAAMAWLTRGQLAREALDARRWSDRHRLLEAGPEARLFGRALLAAQRTQAYWPVLAPLVQAESPSEELSASLWTLAGLLHDHAALREQIAGLARARADLPGNARLGDELADRIEHVERSRIPVYREIERRLTALEALAAECRGFVRDERVVRRAREAVRRADLLLGRIAPPDGAAPDPAHELAERTRAVIGAYRELQQEA